MLRRDVSIMKDEKQSETRERLRKNNLSGATCTSAPGSIQWIPQTAQAIGSGMAYTEPSQGYCDDCYFLAALISVAYAAVSLLKIYPNYKFYDTIGNAWSPSFPVNKDLAVDSSNQNKLVYAKSNTQYIWPGFYEKAYAMWRNNNVTNNHPTMATLCGGGSALTALWQITGKKPNTNAWPPFVAPTGRTQYPTVVDTKSSATTLKQNHSYTVLKYSGGKYYLYDPCGCTTVTVSNTNDFSGWGYI